jgi:hypothetical protein
MTNSCVSIKDILKDIVLFRHDDVIDKTKCSVTAKNIFNYIMNVYSDNTENISWNDTLNNNYIELEEFTNVDKKNCVFYVYYEHVTGETSHYFIMMYDNDENFIVLQSAVFEYSIMDWMYPDNMTHEHTNLDGRHNEEMKKYVEEQNIKNEIEKNDTAKKNKVV